MRLDRLHLHNFRCYEDATFEFQTGFNLVVGVNGSGKTSLLQAVAVSLSPFVNALRSVHIWQDFHSDENARFVVDDYDGRKRFERRYPCTLIASGEAFTLKKWDLVKSAPNEHSSLADFYTAVTASKSAVSANISTDLPILALYPANRRWTTSRVTAEYAATQQPSRLDGYRDWSNGASDIKELEAWLIGKTLERLETMANQHTALASFNDELTWLNTVLKIALSDAADLRYDLKLRMLMMDMGKGQSIPFNELSDGQRSMIALIADIARRMCLLNPHMGTDVLTKTAGIIVIDELDIHLHPEWQRAIVSTLKKSFPKVQFIAASHSPQIIGGLGQHEVMILDNHNISHPRVTYGLDSSSVLEEVMRVAQREPAIEALLNELFSIIEDGNLPLATTKLNELKTKAPDLPEFYRAEALLKRKGVLGK
jgi:predicted ATP-binding protein involved in virulence